MLYVSIIIFSALLYTYYHFRDRVPILMYHRIASVPGDRNALPEEKFEEQMRYLEENGFHSITVDELQAHFLHGKRLPKKPVVLTFDDGYEDNFSAALPILKKYRHVGTERSCRRRRSAGINWGWRFSMMSRCGHKICLPCPAFRFLPGSRCGNLN